MEILTPIFFVGIGTKVDIISLCNIDTLFIGLAISVVAILGKLFAGLPIRDRQVDKTAVGIGMIARGEVGTVFIELGTKRTFNGTPLLNDQIAAALMVMIVITTLLGPWAFGWYLKL